MDLNTQGDIKARKIIGHVEEWDLQIKQETFRIYTSNRNKHKIFDTSILEHIN